MKTHCKCGTLLNPEKPNASECPECARIRARTHYYTKVRPLLPNIVTKDARKKERAAAIALARAEGATHYIVSYPCKKGHFSKRLLSTDQCCECLRERKKTTRKLSDEELKNRARNTYRRGMAKRLGQTRFTSLIACKHGHLGERLVSTGQCCECLAKRDASAPPKPKTRILNKGSKRSRVKASRAKARRYYADTLSKDPIHKLRSTMHQFIRRLFISKNGEATSAILGYTAAQLKERIEFNFKDGMSWDNRGLWHIDHIKPIDRFIAQGVTDPRLINALSNLRPMWAKENISKGSRFSPPQGRGSKTSSA